MQLPTERGIAKLPLHAKVAFAAVAARIAFRAFREAQVDESTVKAARYAIDIAEQTALGGKGVDPREIETAHTATVYAWEEAQDCFTEASESAMCAVLLAKAVSRSETSDPDRLTTFASIAARGATTAGATSEEVISIVNAIILRAESEGWGDEDPVTQTIFEEARKVSSSYDKEIRLEASRIAGDDLPPTEIA